MHKSEMFCQKKSKKFDFKNRRLFFLKKNRRLFSCAL